MSDINLYLCGGSGINIGGTYKRIAKCTNGKEANFIGIDFSGNNIPDNDLFPVLQGNEGGSGKVRSENYKGTDIFLESVLSQHKPNKFNIVVMSSSGGSGSVIGHDLIKELLIQDKVVVGVIIGDNSSNVEMQNNVNTFMTLDSYRRELNKPIAYTYAENQTGKTRGQINEGICNRLDLLSMLLTEQNEEMDYKDVRNFFCYTNATNIPATLTQLNFFDQDSIKEYKGKPPVALASLYTSRDQVTNRLSDVAYRTTGVFKAGIKLPDDMTEFHVTLDHGESVAELLKLMGTNKDRTTMSKTRFSSSQNLSDATGPVL